MGSGLLSVECNARSFLERRLFEIEEEINCKSSMKVGKHVSYLLAAIKMITATMIVPHIAALAAMVILSIFDACAVTVLTSLHC